MHACQFNSIRKYIDGIDDRIDNQLKQANTELMHAIDTLDCLKAELEACGGTDEKISNNIKKAEKTIKRLKQRRDKLNLV